MPRTPNPPGISTPSTPSSCRRRALGGLAVVAGHPADVDLGVVGEPAGAQRLGRRQVGVGQVDVLADQRDGDAAGRAGAPGAAGRPSRSSPRRGTAGRAGGPRRRRGPRSAAPWGCRRSTARRPRTTTASSSTSHIRLILRLRPSLMGRSDRQHDRVRLDADAAQRGHRVLGGLGLQLAGRADVRQQRHVQEEAAVPADLVPDLADGLQERQRLDVADRAAHLGDDHVARSGPPIVQDAGLDLVGDVRDDLDGVAQVVAAPLLGDDAGVDLAGGDVRRARQVGVEEPLVVPDVEVGLGAVVGDEHLAVLERVHRARVDVEVRVELLHGDPQPARLSRRPRLEAVRPLPRLEATPPVTKRCLVIAGRDENGAAAKGRLPWSVRSGNTRRSTGHQNISQPVQPGPATPGGPKADRGPWPGHTV